MHVNPLAPNYMHQLLIVSDLDSSGVSGPHSPPYLLFETLKFDEAFGYKVLYTLDQCSTNLDAQIIFWSDFREIGFSVITRV